jgi:hypothetical protein
MFCPIFAQQCAALSHKNDMKTPSISNIIIDTIDNKLTLFYAVIIAEPKSEPLWTNIDYIKILRLDFSRFSLFIMYTYQTYPPNFDSSLMHFESRGQAIRGFNAFELNRLIDKKNERASLFTAI